MKHVSRCYPTYQVQHIPNNQELDRLGFGMAGKFEAAVTTTPIRQLEGSSVGGHVTLFTAYDYAISHNTTARGRRFFGGNQTRTLGWITNLCVSQVLRTKIRECLASSAWRQPKVEGFGYTYLGRGEQQPDPNDYCYKYGYGIAQRYGAQSTARLIEKLQRRSGPTSKVPFGSPYSTALLPFSHVQWP